MRSGHLVDPELMLSLDTFPTLQLSNDILPRLREAVVSALASAGVVDHLSVTVERVEFPGPAGAPPVPALIYRPPSGEETSHGILLQIHGGGYITGCAQMSDPDNRRICAELGCTVVSVDYRLAPETPHPGPVEDCYCVLKALHGGWPSINGDRTRIAVSGDSAGGGLAAALALLARDRGEIQVVHQHLIYPMIDDRTCARAHSSPFIGELVWTMEHNRFGWSSLLQVPPGSEGVSPYAAAARAENLEGLPGAFIAVGALDLFLEENLAYASRLALAGVPVELHVYPGAYHGFRRVRNASVAKAANRDSLDALRRVLIPAAP